MKNLFPYYRNGYEINEQNSENHKTCSYEIDNQIVVQNSDVFHDKIFFNLELIFLHKNVMVEANSFLFLSLHQLKTNELKNTFHSTSHYLLYATGLIEYFKNNIFSAL